MVRVRVTQVAQGAVLMVAWPLFFFFGWHLAELRASPHPPLAEQAGLPSQGAGMVTSLSSSCTGTAEVPSPSLVINKCLSLSLNKKVINKSISQKQNDQKQHQMMV